MCKGVKYRKKLKFPNSKINYFLNPEYYIYHYQSDEKEVLEIEPYKTDILKSKNNLYDLFINYINNNDLIGADMIRKFIQISIKKNKDNNLLVKKLLKINNNQIYCNWINSFNWKISDPYKPSKYIK